MVRKNARNGSGKYDSAYHWLICTHGKQWEAWRAYAEEWQKEQEGGYGSRMRAINWFLDKYLVAQGLSPDPAALFAASAPLPDLMHELKETLSPKVAQIRNNYIVEFIDWVAIRDFSETDDEGNALPMVPNPFERKKGTDHRTETVFNPLPYAHIQELCTIICPNSQGSFGEWTWAQGISGNYVGGRQGDWFELPADRIDPSDPDCVWRERNITRNSRKTTITELWSPVRFVALLVKLYLPLRNYQVRMLDSGEADTWRYEYGRWVPNGKHPFAVGTEKTPWARGVFRRILAPGIGEVMTGLYINTNKTADRNVEDVERGYTIPWQHEEVLYWLERLRNWQEKYNPIDAPTAWADLGKKHVGELKSPNALARMSESCFLFRDASAKTASDRVKPVAYQHLSRYWYLLLRELEAHLAAREQTLSDGSRLRLVKKYDDDVPPCCRTATHFPLHSLRVSLITCYAMDGQVPLPVLSKLLAGHSRILMTLYYTKITPAVMRQKMDEAEARIEAGAQQSLRSFLVDAEMSQIHAKTVAAEPASAEAALVNRNPVSWEHRHIGLCLVGGNTAKSDELGGFVAGCWNGGDLAKDHVSPYHRIYDPVPHGPENCVRCRWFLTNATYLDALRAHLNNLSFHSSLAANLAVELERKKEALEDARFEAYQAGRPFTKDAELQAAQRRYEKQVVDADEYAKDLRACFTLIYRVVEIESAREDDDDRQKLIAVGCMHDVHQPISLIETDSIVWQLSEICEDAEVYTDLADDVRKTPAVEQRSRALNTMLMREGYAPVFLTMDDEMQLIMGNALMRAMAKKASPEDWRIEGYRRVSGIIEAGQSLSAAGLLDHGIEALEQRWRQPVVFLNELTRPRENAALEIDGGTH